MSCACAGCFLRLKNLMRLQICPIERAIIRKPSLPWTPPMGVWINVDIQWIMAIRPVVRVASDTHHKVRVAWLFCSLNFVNQLLFPKCSNTWQAVMHINSIPIMIWIHTDKSPLLWVASSCIPDISIAAVSARRLQLQIFSIAIFFISLIGGISFFAVTFMI